MPVNKPKKPVRSGGNGRRRSTANIPTDILAPKPSRSGAGAQFVDQFLSKKGQGGRIAIGQDLPLARPPLILPERGADEGDIEARAREKRIANTRRSAANNVRGTIIPGSPTGEDEAILHITSDQAYPSDAILEGTYHFPQVAPTKTINPLRPRTLEAGYEAQTDGPGRGTLRVRFRDGTAWEYYDVEPDVWQRFKRSASPGRFINRVLNSYEYGPGNF